MLEGTGEGMKLDYADAVRFHGHSCPGLALGYRVAEAALARLGGRAEDEELVAVVENDACGVDAIQWLTGCTFGKGNLIFRDYGKHVFTFYSRVRQKGVRIRGDLGRGMASEVSARLHSLREKKKREGLTAAEQAEWEALLARRVEEILSAPAETLLEVREVPFDPPPRASLHDSAPCDRCGEYTMVTRLQTVGGHRYCLPCAGAEAGG